MVFKPQYFLYFLDRRHVGAGDLTLKSEVLRIEIDAAETETIGI